MKVYVGGTIGDPPTVVTTSLVEALIQTASMHVVGGCDDDAADVKWTCLFVDGELTLLRWIAEVDDARLYIQLMDVGGMGIEAKS